jgi:hypothetical protein
MSEPTIPAQADSIPTQPENERRTTIRIRCNHWVRYRLQPLERYERCWANVRNLSAGGIALLTNRHVKPDTRLVLELRSRTSDAIVTRSARVAHATRDSAGNWVIGCEFDTPLDEAERDDFV